MCLLLLKFIRRRNVHGQLAYIFISHSLLRFCLADLAQWSGPGCLRIRSPYRLSRPATFMAYRILTLTTNFVSGPICISSEVFLRSRMWSSWITRTGLLIRYYVWVVNFIYHLFSSMFCMYSCYCSWGMLPFMFIFTRRGDLVFLCTYMCTFIDT